MIFFHVLSFLAILSATLSYPIDSRSQVASLDFSAATNPNDATTASESADLSGSMSAASNAALDVSEGKTDATSKGSTGHSAIAKAPFGPFAQGSPSGGTAKAALGFSSRMPSMEAVQQATMNFAKDANTVSASLNQLPDETSANTIRSLATTAFNAESDEDAQRAVLAAAAGSAGSASNTKIVENTPTVLKGLKAIMQSPTASAVKSNVVTIQNSR
jgi:hypothetical protein